MKVWSVLSFLLPVAALAVLGARKVRGRWRVAREVVALQGLGRPRRVPRRTRR